MQLGEPIFEGRSPSCWESYTVRPDPSERARNDCERASHRSFLRSTLLLLSSLIPFLISSERAFAQASDKADRPDDTVWEISSRHLRDGGTTAFDALHVRRVQELNWTDSTVAEFADACNKTNAPSHTHTVFYVHGNWTSAVDARKRGWMVYNALSRRAQHPIRFVVFSWDAERHSGFARDVRDKRAQLNLESLRLANVLRRVPEENTVGMLGFSFGAAVISGAIHLDAGGKLSGRSAGERMDRSAVYASFLAPAFNRSDFGPNGEYRLAAFQSNTILNLFNSSDPILKRFRLIDRKESPIAAGYEGLPILKPSSANTDPNSKSKQIAKVLQVDCANQVGRTHAELAYYQECSYFSAGLNNLLGIQR
ncbi:MAG: hypothetical protein ACE361_22485 [Aureliella sp.]